VNPFLSFLLSPIYDNALAPEHLADLRKSALTDETIAEQHIRSVPPATLHHTQLLGFDLPGVRSAMLLPFCSPDGGFMDFARVKIFPTLVKVTRDETVRWIPEAEQQPRDLKHETVKYLQSKKSGARLYLVRRCLRAALESDADLWIVEGEKKALAIAQLGLPTIGICGVEGWHGRGDDHLLRDFNAIRLEGRRIEILPDGDYQTNLNVERAVRRFATALRARGARPAVRLLPRETSR
jgi:hypothetical protein